MPLSAFLYPADRPGGPSAGLRAVHHPLPSPQLIPAGGRTTGDAQGQNRPRSPGVVVVGGSRTRVRGCSPPREAGPGLGAALIISRKAGPGLGAALTSAHEPGPAGEPRCAPNPTRQLSLLPRKAKAFATGGGMRRHLAVFALRRDITSFGYCGDTYVREGKLRPVRTA
jgi:hypothetical protein